MNTPQWAEVNEIKPDCNCELHVQQIVQQAFQAYSNDLEGLRGALRTIKACPNCRRAVTLPKCITEQMGA